MPTNKNFEADTAKSGQRRLKRCYERPEMAHTGNSLSINSVSID